MSLTRSQLAQSVAADLAPILRMAGISASDSYGAMKEAIDRALRALGYAEADLATAEIADGGERRAIIYLTHALLQRAMLMLAGTETGAAFLKAYQAIFSEAEMNALRFGWNDYLVPLPHAGGIDADDHNMLFSIEDELVRYTNEELL